MRPVLAPHGVRDVDALAALRHIEWHRLGGTPLLGYGCRCLGCAVFVYVRDDDRDSALRVADGDCPAEPAAAARDHRHAAGQVEDIAGVAERDAAVIRGHRHLRNG